MKKLIFDCLTTISRFLPLWRHTNTVNIIPRLEWLRVEPPLNLNQLPSRLASQFVRAKSIPPRRVFVLKNVCVNSHGVVFKDLRIFTPSLPWIHDIKVWTNGSFLFSQWRKSVKKIADGNYVLIYDHWAMSNYYHWMIESLPRLYVVGKMYPDCTIILPESVHEYVTKSISLMGFNKFLRINDDEVIKMHSIIFPEIVYYDGVENEDEPPANLKSDSNPFLREELIVSVRKRLLQSMDIARAYRRIYVSRSRSKIRRLVNEREILEVLDKLGFEIVFFEGMSFIDQVKLMRETAVLAGVHGSNMVNILCLPETSDVVELMNEDYLNDAFYLLSSSVGVSYYSVPCSMEDQSLKTSKDKVAINDADLVVDVDFFKRTLAGIVESADVTIVA